MSNKLLQLATVAEARTTSLIIAHGTGNKHARVFKLTRFYLHELLELGSFSIEYRPFGECQKDMSDFQYAKLNEQQSALLITYLRDTKIVREFKIKLAQAFHEARRGDPVDSNDGSRTITEPLDDHDEDDKLFPEEE